MNAPFGIYLRAASSYMSVLMPPGAMALTVMFLLPKSRPGISAELSIWGQQRWILTHSKTPCERFHSALAPGINRMIRHAFGLRTDAAEHDQPATSRKVLESLLGDEQLAPRIDCEDPIEFFRRDLGDVAKWLDSGIRDHNVQVTIMLDSLLEHGDDLRWLWHVRFDGNRPAPEPFDFGDHGLGGTRGARVVDDQVGTALGELKGVLATHPTTRAGHEGDSPIEAGGWNGWWSRHLQSFNRSMESFCRRSYLSSKAWGFVFWSNAWRMKTVDGESDVPGATRWYLSPFPREVSRRLATLKTRGRPLIGFTSPSLSRPARARSWRRSTATNGKPNGNPLAAALMVFLIRLGLLPRLIGVSAADAP